LSEWREEDEVVDEEKEGVAWLAAMVARWWLWLDDRRGVVVICTVLQCALRSGWP